MQQNKMKLEFDSRPCNEGFARVAVAAFMTQLNPTLEEVADVKNSSIRGSNERDYPRL